MVKISIIIPVFNAENYLRKCIDNVLKQTIDSFEIICIDDGSTDHSEDILLEYASKYNYIKVLSQENKGAGEARNRGLRVARGEFVAFMDADDYYPEKDTLEKLYNLATEKQVKIAGGGMSVCASESEMRVLHRFEYDGIMKYSDYSFDFGFTCFIYSKEMLLSHNIFFPPFKVFEDPVFFVSAMIRAEKFYAVKDITYCYSGAHNVDFNLKKTSDLLKALTENLKKSSKHKLGKLHLLTIKRLEETGSYYIEKYLDQREIFYELLNAYAAIDFSLLKEIDSQYNDTFILEPLELLWKVYVKYNSLRNTNLVKVLRKLIR